MVDLDAGTCDFDKELFFKLLEVSKLYGYDPRKNTPLLARHTSIDNIFSSLNVQDNTYTLISGILFDDGFHPMVSDAMTLSINAKSAHKDGAWEFIRFLLSETVQKGPCGWNTPVLRTALDQNISKSLEPLLDSPYGSMWSDLIEGERVDTFVLFQPGEITGQMIQNYRDMAENARFLPARTSPLLKIICDEANYYFEGSKSIEEVRSIIENRVQLYINEHK